MPERCQGMIMNCKRVVNHVGYRFGNEQMMKGASFTQRTISSISVGGSISSEGFLSSILLVVVIIVMVVIVVVILIVIVVAIVGVVIVVMIFGVVVVVDDVSLIFKLSFVIIERKSVGPVFCWVYLHRAIVVALCFSELWQDALSQYQLLDCSQSSSGTKKYRGSNSSDGGNTGDGVKIAGGVIESCGEIGMKKIDPVFESRVVFPLVRLVSCSRGFKYSKVVESYLYSNKGKGAKEALQSDVGHLYMLEDEVLRLLSEFGGLGL
ncbi:hypothetical protein Tco_1144936 [Tanacetum coccineum]